ncbi:hypothetical protein BH23BAC4_BH23BAC4_01540 [soil metagenome]
MVESMPVLPMSDERLSPVEFAFARDDVDTITILAPEGFRIEAVPADISTEFAHGTFVRSAQIQPDGTAVVLSRRLVWNSRRVAAEVYEEARAFLATVARADSERLVISPRTE